MNRPVGRPREHERSMQTFSLYLSRETMEEIDRQAEELGIGRSQATQILLDGALTP
jgi:hypothetical protein